MPFLGLVFNKEYKKLLAEVEALKATPEYANWLLKTADANKYNMPDPSVFGNQADLFRRLSWVLQAVNITASSGSLPPFNVSRVVSGKEPKDIPNHPFELLLSHPNELDSRFEFLYATIAYWMLTGNTYWWLNRDDEFSPPTEMWIIPSNMIIPVPDAKMYIRGYRYFPGDGSELLLPPYEIIHFKRFNPNNRFLGLSAIEAIALVSQGDISMQDWNTRLFKDNNARLPGIMTFEQMIADPTWEKIKQDTREASKKRELLMLRGVGQGGVNWQQNAVSQKDMEFLEGRKANKEEIMGTLAPGLYSMLSENATEANSRTGRTAFWELTVYPIHVMINEKVTNEILPSYPGRPLIGAFEDVRFEDKAMKMQEEAQFALSHTIKEIRMEWYGDEPLGDDRDNLLPAQVTPLSGVKEEPPAPAPAQNKLPMEGEQEAETETEQPEEQGSEDTTENNPTESEKNKPDLTAKFEELRKFERATINKKGKPFEFKSIILSENDIKRIQGKLALCNSVADVKATFDEERRKLKQSTTKDAAIVLEGIRLAVERMK